MHWTLSAVQNTWASNTRNGSRLCSSYLLDNHLCGSHLRDSLLCGSHFCSSLLCGSHSLTCPTIICVTVIWVTVTCVAVIWLIVSCAAFICMAVIWPWQLFVQQSCMRRSFIQKSFVHWSLLFHYWRLRPKVWVLPNCTLWPAHPLYAFPINSSVSSYRLMNGLWPFLVHPIRTSAEAIPSPETTVTPGWATVSGRLYRSLKPSNA